LNQAGVKTMGHAIPA